MDNDMVQLLTPDGQRVERPGFSFVGSDDDLAQYPGGHGSGQAF